MKKAFFCKTVSLLLILTFLISFASCGSPDGGKKPADGTTTLMVYMIGSDLEAKDMSSTNDMEEMAASGVDLNANNVLVYTGGCPKWHNEIADYSENNVILRLTEDGFTQEKTEAQSSMGEPETLSSFLNYCVETYPADHYALILWNHGSGPVIGYGKDILFEQDALTLAEMDEAMKNSPFSEDNQLEWVGFDACLMASAELSCIWSRYAKYLIASQEIEPSFGWSYQFLNKLGFSSGEELFQTITSGYLDSCTEYFKKKNYQDRVATLACIDLSVADRLCKAINALFAKAKDDIGDRYDALAASRVNTRALGRASTGSEYDLIDLLDLCTQLGDLYPEETQELSDVIGEMVVCNSNNSGDLCGVSLFYPFYNKSYYEKEWREIYGGLSVFEDYNDYLALYEKIWLGSDMMKKSAVSKKPSMESSEKYSLELTDDQVKHYASARYYILKKDSGETFSKVYSSSNVTLSGNTLTAQFDGNVIYFHNDIDEYILPETIEHDTVGDITNYSIPLFLNDAKGESFLYATDQDVSFLKCRYVIAANKNKGEIAISALMPNETEESGSDLMGGKYEEVDVSKYTTYQFMDVDHASITRTDNGVIRPFDEWRFNGWHSWNELAIADGAEFIYAPLANGKYAMVFEICDTQGSLYCSEPIDLDTSGYNRMETKKTETVTVDSNGTYPLLLKEDDSFALYLDVVKEDGVDKLTFFTKNKTDGTLKYVADSLILNETVSAEDGFAPSTTVDAGAETQPYVETDFSTGSDEPTIRTFTFGDAEEAGAVKSLSSLQFTYTLTDYDTKKTLWDHINFNIRFSKNAEFKLNCGIMLTSNDKLLADAEPQPILGAEIEKQTLFDNEALRIELLFFGAYDKNSYTGEYYDNTAYGLFRIVNKSADQHLYIFSEGLAIDGIYMENSIPTCDIPPNTLAYRTAFLSSFALEELGIVGFTNMSWEFCYSDDDLTATQKYGEEIWCDVKIKKASKKLSSFAQGKTVLMDENDVTISLLDHEYPYEGCQSWVMTIKNDRKSGVQIGINNLEVDGVSYEDNADNSPILCYREKCGPGQNAKIEISDTEDKVKDVRFTFVIYDFTGSKILFESKKTIHLKSE